MKKEIFKICILFFLIFSFIISCNSAEVKSDNTTVTPGDSTGGSDSTATAKDIIHAYDTVHLHSDTPKHTNIVKIIKSDSLIKKTKKIKTDSIPVIDIAKLNTEGLVVWELPEAMKTLEESLVKVRIATSANEAPAKKGIDINKKNSGFDTIIISEKMKVTLVSGNESDFIIVAKDTIHSIPSKKYAEWFWTVTPLKSGTRFLILKVSQVSIVNGKETVLEENSVFSKEFKVSVSAAYVAAQTWNFIKSNWAIIATIITFFAGLFVRKKVMDARKPNP